MEVIIVTGTPGTGKTTLAKQLAEEKHYKYVDVNEVIEENDLSEGVDEEKECKIIDVKKLSRILVELIKKNDSGLVIDSHLSHYLPPRYVNKCIVTKCSLKALKKRLQARGYSEKKIRENLDAEIFDTCRIEALERGHIVEVIDTGKII